jgi:hypothetical protein
VEVLGVVAFRASPVWVLAALADLCGMGRHLIRKSRRLKAQGLLDKDANSAASISCSMVPSARRRDWRRRSTAAARCAGLRRVGGDSTRCGRDAGEPSRRAEAIGGMWTGP